MMKRKLRILLRYLAALLVALSILAPWRGCFDERQRRGRSDPGAAGVAAASVGLQPLRPSAVAAAR